MSNPFVPKARRPKFQVKLCIHELTNIPLVSGYVHVKWHVSNCTRADARGKTELAPIRDHKAVWDYERECQLRMIIDRSHKLTSTILMLEVIQELHGGRDRLSLGTVQLNLAQYTHVSKDSRKHLLQNSKVNSTLNLTISVKQISGELNYIAPPLEKARVFSGIAGLLQEGKELKTRDQAIDPNANSLEKRILLSSGRDMYQQSLACKLSKLMGEMDPVDLVEDIFAGGDGWYAGRGPRRDEGYSNHYPYYDDHRIDSHSKRRSHSQKQNQSDIEMSWADRELTETPRSWVLPSDKWRNREVD